MAEKGWISVRDIPGTKDKTIKEVLDSFKKKFSLCKKCKGEGHTVDDHDTVYEGVSCVRVSDSKALLSMQEKGTLNKNVFKRIIETMVHNRKQCDKCHGFGFVKKIKEEG